MENMWSPWRSEYIKGFKNKDKIEGCFVCYAIEDNDDEENLLVARFSNSIVLMNRYPYNNGHLLICPNSHNSDLNDVGESERTELMQVINISTSVIKKVYKPHGYNIGLNAGSAAGAGLPGHLHFHILPRWNGDTNFTATIADIKVVNESMRESYQSLKKEFEKYTD